jgi:hypothetical protein
MSFRPHTSSSLAFLLLVACSSRPASDPANVGEGSEDETADSVTMGEDEDGGPDTEPGEGSSDGGPGGDGDGDGDAIEVLDLCPLTPELDLEDSDGDGVGDACDNCPRPTTDYNTAQAGDLPEAKYWARNNPNQGDRDRDGQGDVCDGCVGHASCEDWSPSNPHPWGQAEVEHWSTDLCGPDGDANMIGDHCEGLEDPTAAGPIGFAADDDFDQDGIVNQQDICPRNPVEGRACSTDDDCAADEHCETVAGLCQHADTDGDGVGNACDTCPFAPNPEQTTATGMLLDDEDGDFVGAACESAPACSTTPDPAPVALFEVSAHGFCCVTTFPGDGRYVESDDATWSCEGLCDPKGLPITRDCEHEPADPSTAEPDGIVCRKLPETLGAPSKYGVLDLPPGCAEALANAGRCDPGDPTCEPESANAIVGQADIGVDVHLGDYLCRLPQRDADFDGVGDACDPNPTSFDPADVIDF